MPQSHKSAFLFLTLDTASAYKTDAHTLFIQEGKTLELCCRFKKLIFHLLYLQRACFSFLSATAQYYRGPLLPPTPESRANYRTGDKPKGKLDRRTSLKQVHIIIYNEREEEIRSNTTCCLLQHMPTCYAM